MAQSPDINETFLREVDENLRRDRARDFARRHGKWLVAAMVLFLAAAGGFIYWQQHRQTQQEAQLEQLASIYRDIGAGNIKNAPAALAPLAKDGSDAVRASALFTAAALAVEQNDTAGAIAKFKQIAEDDGLPAAYRNLALIRQTALEFDRIKPDDVIARMAPLAKSGEPYFGSAAELTGAALIKQGKSAEAGRTFAAIANDRGVPDALRARASQLATTLGVEMPPLDTPAQ